MKKLNLLLAFMAIVAVSCQKELVDNSFDEVSTTTEVVADNIRSYDEALAIAEEALLLLEDDSTRATSSRKIKRNEGQVVMSPATRSGETSEQPIMYIFNNENNEGFTIIAASKDEPSIIAVTDQGNYTYGVPTGVEPFDLLMEDVAMSLTPIPITPGPTKTETENEDIDCLELPVKVHWGMGYIYGAYYPDGLAYDEATAIAQILLTEYNSTFTYSITNPNNNQYGQNVTIDMSELAKHVRYNTLGQAEHTCISGTHDQISTLLLEIGYRLSNGSGISLNNKTTAFDFQKVKSVLDSFNITTYNITTYNIEALIPPRLGDNFLSTSFVFRGNIDPNMVLPENSNAHVWMANGFLDKSYDLVHYMKNSFINPNHPDPDGYTETHRETMHEYMFYINWGYDGMGNGWYRSGCFDMSRRTSREDAIEMNPTEGGNYNFDNIYCFKTRRLAAPPFPSISI